MLFSLSPNAAGTTYAVTSTDDSPRALTFPGEELTQVSVTSDTGSDTQAWIIQPAQTDASGGIFTSGQYLRFVPATDTTLSLDLTWQSRLNSIPPVGTWTANEGANTDPTNSTNQKWLLVPE
jgi:hypothetical protein